MRYVSTQHFSFLNQKQLQGSNVPAPSSTLEGLMAKEILTAIARPAAIVSAALIIMHPEQYYEGVKNHVHLQGRALSGELPIWDILQLWASVFTSLSVIVNQETPIHREVVSRARWFDILTSTGSYYDVDLVLPSLQMKLKYEAGVMVGMSRKVVRHRVPRAWGAQICWVWNMQEEVHKYTNTPRGGWSSLGLSLK